MGRRMNTRHGMLKPARVKPRRARAGAPQRWWRALADFYAGPFRVDPALSDVSSRVLERHRRRRLFMVLITTLGVLECGSLVGQEITGAPLSVMLAQVGALAVTALCLLLNRYDHTTLATLLYLFASSAGVLFSLTQLGGVLDLRGLMILTIFAIFVVLSGLLLPRWAIWLVAALVLATGVTALLSVPLTTVTPRTDITVVRPVVVGIYMIVMASLAVLTWIFSRSGSAGLESVAQALTRERELAALKDLFIIDANHELRTPIMALYNNLELLDLLWKNGAPAERQQQVLARALTSGNVLIRLLNTILDPTMLEGRVPPLRLEAIPLAELIRTVLETFDPREVGEAVPETATVSPRSVNLSIADACVVRADPMRLRQVLTNVIANALKYSPAGTPIEITAAITSETLHHPPSPTPSAPHALEPVLIQIRDFGPGIPAREQPKLFNRFVRLERDIAGPVRGTGIGLFVCRTLVEAMGGTIWVESSGIEGEGSTFCFTLPGASTLSERERPLAVELPTISSV